MKINSLRTTLSGEDHNITGQTSLGLDPFDKQLFITLFTNFSALLHCGMYHLWYCTCIANIVIISLCYLEIINLEEDNPLSS